jgi:hypothetical protein
MSKAGINIELLTHNLAFFNAIANLSTKNGHFDGFL